MRLLLAATPWEETEMSATEVRLTYELKVSKTTFQDLPDHVHEMATRLGLSPKTQRISVTLSSRGLTWEYGDKQEIVVYMNLNTGARLLLDHKRKEYVKLEHGPEILTLGRNKFGHWTRRRIGDCQECHIGELQTLAQRYDFYGVVLAL